MIDLKNLKKCIRMNFRKISYYFLYNYAIEFEIAMLINRKLKHFLN